MKLNAFIIHLDRAVTRSSNVQRLKEQFPFSTQVVPAVDSLELTENSLRSYHRFVWNPRYPFQLSRGEIACFQSHRKCWQYILDLDLDCGLVVEDDVEIERSVFSDSLQLAMSCIQQGDFVRFPVKRREVHGLELETSGGIIVRRPSEVGLGMQAQLVTREAAAAFLELTSNFDRPVDTFVQMPWLHAQRILSVWPSGVKEVSKELGGSTLGNGHITLRGKLFREVLRPLYRGRIRKLAGRYYRSESSS